MEDIPQLHPFGNEELYLDVKFNLLQDGETKNGLKAVSNINGSGYDININQRYIPGSHFANLKPLNFASDDEYEYYLNYSAMAIGEPGRQTVVFNYTCYKARI